MEAQIKTIPLYQQVEDVSDPLPEKNQKKNNLIVCLVFLLFLSLGISLKQNKVANDFKQSQVLSEREISLITYMVKDYDQAIDWFTSKLDFVVTQDQQIDAENKLRWVVLTPSSKGTSFLLARATNEAEFNSVGSQTGTHVSFFLSTNNFHADHELLMKRGVLFREDPRYESYGTVAVFSDLYGNTWDLIQHDL